MNTSIHTITIKINIFNVSLPSTVKDVSQMPCKPTADKRILKAFIKISLNSKPCCSFAITIAAPTIADQTKWPPIAVHV